MAHVMLPTKKFKVVFIDDEKDLCLIFKDLNATKDVEIYTFSDPRNEFEEIRRIEADLIIIDYHLKDLKGHEFVKALPLKTPKVLITGDHLNLVPVGFLKVIHKSDDLSFLSSLIDELGLQKI